MNRQKKNSNLVLTVGITTVFVMSINMTNM